MLGNTENDPALVRVAEQPVLLAYKIMEVFSPNLHVELVIKNQLGIKIQGTEVQVKQ